MNEYLSTLKLLPHLYTGNKLYDILFPRKANPILYITNRCNSKCNICNHWKQNPKIDLPVPIIKKLLEAKSIYKNNFVMEGGEAEFHPEFERILKLFKNKYFMLFTNGIDTERLVRLVDIYKIPLAHISLDGLGETYLRVRGVDKYNEVLNTINSLKSITDVAVNFTISAWNSFIDYYNVRKECGKMNVKLLINILSSMKYMGLTQKEKMIDSRFANYDKRPYITYYNNWVLGLIKVPCLAVRFTTVIRPNGDIMLCQYKDIILGNLHDNSFDEIWSSDRTKDIHKDCITCNDCWVSSHRAFDIRFELLKRRKLT